MSPSDVEQVVDEPKQRRSVQRQQRGKVEIQLWGEDQPRVTVRVARQWLERTSPRGKTSWPTPELLAW